MTVRTTLKNRWVLPVVVLLLFLYIFDPYRGWYILLLGLGGVLLLSFLWARSLAAHLHVQRERRYGWTQVGDRLEERFCLKNHGWFPALWVEVADQSQLPGYHPGRATFVGAFEETVWTAEAFCTKRGLFTLGPLTLSSGDPFGLFEVRFEAASVSTVLVTPPVLSLPPIDVAPGGRAGDGRMRLHTLERSVSVSGVRNYVAGDSLRLVHWPTTVRKQDLYVRVMESTPASDWWIFLDLEEGVQAGTEEENTEEHGVVLAASILEQGLREGTPVGLAVQGGPQAAPLFWLPPRMGGVHYQGAMHALALAGRGPLGLDQLLFHSPDMVRMNPSLILITANTRPDWIRHLPALIQRGVAPTVLLLDPNSYGVDGVHPDADILAGALTRMGVPVFIFDAAMFDRPEMRPGTRGRWVWGTAKSGRAHVVMAPENATWEQV